jgi:hypothetical protein
MNRQRRKQIRDAYDLISEAKDLIDQALEEEQECYDNLPEGIQCSERGEEMENNVDQLQECSDNLDYAIDALEEFI